MSYAGGPFRTNGQERSRSAAAALTLLALLFGPFALPALFLTAYFLPRKRQVRWANVALVFGGFAAVYTVSSVMFSRVGFIAIFWGWVTWLPKEANFGWQLFAIATAMAIEVPCGIALGACVVGVAEALCRGQEWHPVEMRRTEMAAVEQEKKVLKAVRSALEGDSRPASPNMALGAAQEGDLTAWCRDGYVYVPSRTGGLAVAGAPGSGKTETALALIPAYARAGKKIVFIDGKSTDVQLPVRVVASVVNALGPDIKVISFPDEPLNGWIGRTTDVLNRLIQSQVMDNPFYQATSQTLLRLVLSSEASAVRKRLVDSSAEFMARLNEPFLRSLRGTGRDAEIDALLRERQTLTGLILRYRGFFEALNGGFDGEASFGDADVVIMKLPFARSSPGAWCTSVIFREVMR